MDNSIAWALRGHHKFPVLMIIMLLFVITFYVLSLSNHLSSNFQPINNLLQTQIL